jgi:hypothetical protein
LFTFMHTTSKYSYLTVWLSSQLSLLNPRVRQMFYGAWSLYICGSSVLKGGYKILNTILVIQRKFIIMWKDITTDFLKADM